MIADKNPMSESYKVKLQNNALSAVDIYSPTAVSTTRQIAGSTIIHSPDLITIDKLYPNIVIVERIQWDDISYAHVILTPRGEYFLSLFAGPNLFNEYAVLFIPLGSDRIESVYHDSINLFSEMLVDRVRSGQVSCFPEDLLWL